MNTREQSAQPADGGSMAAPEVMLIALPWEELGLGSIRLGILQNVLRRAGIPVEVRSYYLAFMDHLIASTATLSEPRRLTVEHYEDVATRRYWDVGMGDWIFAVPPFRTPSALVDERYFAYLRAHRVPEEAIGRAVQMRALVPAFLEECVRDVLAAGPRVVGFTSSFSQNVGSLGLAKMLKEHDPSLRVVFGGANCDGPMGAALHRAFPWVDVVVRGEGEQVLPALARDLLAGGPVQPQPGLCYRDGSRSVVVEQGGPAIAMDDVPAPDYDEYFARLRASRFRNAVASRTRIVFESARGCWWGQKHHCTFCGLNGTAMKFRSKAPGRVAEEITGLAGRYQHLDFEAVDNIIDLQYLRTLVPQLREMRRAGLDFTFFYETKANLTRAQIRLLSEAGVVRIQPGIESLSTPILRLMRKGVTALQNIRLLKWAQAYKIQVTWNLLYGFPGEPPDEYARMAEVMPSLTHLRPPRCTGLRVHRFSPYHEAPAAFSLRLTGPAPYYQHIYELDEAALADIAYEFSYEYADGRDPEQYIGPAKEAAEVWGAAYDAGSSLTYRRGPGFLRITDRRTTVASRIYSFAETEAQIYLACEDGATPAAVWERLPEADRALLAVGDVEAFLVEMEALRLVYREGGVFLSLALPANPLSESMPPLPETAAPASHDAPVHAFATLGP